MNFEELLKACSSGQMPKVRLLVPDKKIIGPFGQVTTIKNNGNYKGVGITFMEPKYEVWFWDSEEGDKRTHYMRDLEIATDY